MNLYEILSDGVLLFMMTSLCSMKNSEKYIRELSGVIIWVTHVFDDIIESLPSGSVFYRISAENDVTKSNTYLPKDYRARRDKK